MKIMFYNRSDEDISDMMIDQLIQSLQMIRTEWGENCIVRLPQVSLGEDNIELKWNARICNIEIDTDNLDNRRHNPNNKTEILLY